MLTALALLKAVYLGILGFADFVPKNAPAEAKALFTVPLLCWLAAIYFSVRVMMTKEYALQLRSPDDIREKSLEMLRSKQRDLLVAFWLLTAGLIAAIAPGRFSADMSERPGRRKSLGAPGCGG